MIGCAKDMQGNIGADAHLESLTPNERWSNQQNSFDMFKPIHHSDDDSSYSIPNSDVVEALLANNENNQSVRLKDLMLLQNSFINSNREKAKSKDKKIKELEATIESLQNRLKRMERRIVLSNKNVEQECEMYCKRCQSQQWFSSSWEDRPHATDNKRPAQSKTMHPVKFEKKITSITQMPDVKPRKEELSTPAKKPPDSNSFLAVVTPSTEKPDSISTVISTTPKIMQTPVKTTINYVSDSITPTTNCVTTVAKCSKPSVKNFFNTAGHESMYLAAGVCNSSELSESDNSSAIMKTRTSYHKHLSNANDGFNPNSCDDLINSNTVLKLPSWKVQPVDLTKLSQSELENICLYEPTGNDVYYKRHTKFEVAEKRRKRWDIQRIREWRYNEKLRQKLLKNDPNNTARLESFSPCAWDMQSIHVDDSLPVTVFGRVLPLLTPSEFNLPNHLQSAPS